MAAEIVREMQRYFEGRMAPHLSTFLRVYTESSVDDVQPDIRALLYGDTKDLASDGCIVIRHGPSTANILQELKNS